MSGLSPGCAQLPAGLPQLSLILLPAGAMLQEQEITLQTLPSPESTGVQPLGSSSQPQSAQQGLEGPFLFINLSKIWQVNSKRKF